MQQPTVHGTVHHGSGRSTDYLYRISIKCIVRDPSGKVLVIKESGRGYWDLPGGGMDHGESIKDAIAREMLEEVSLQGDFSYRIVTLNEPKLLTTHNFWQLRLVFEIRPSVFEFKPGVDCDEMSFIDPIDFKDADNPTEAFIYECHKS